MLCHGQLEDCHESFLYRWLWALAMFDITCSPAFVGASVINGIQAFCQ